MALIDKASLLMVPSTYEAGKLYNVLPSGNRAPDSTDQNSGYDQTRADFDFDRGSNAAATRIGSDGLLKKYRENLLTFSNDFTSGSWNDTGGSFFTSGQSGYDGTNDAWLYTNTVATERIQLTISETGVNTFSGYFKKGVADGVRLRVDMSGTDANFYVNLIDGSVYNTTGSISSNVSSVGNGWYRLEFSANWVSVNNIRIHPTDTSGAVALGSVYLQNLQIESGLCSTDYLNSTDVTAKSGVLIDLPRINYDANGENGNLLLEPSRQQLLQYSEYFGSYTPLSATITDNVATSPEGLINAASFIETSASGRHRTSTNSFSVTSGNAYTLSMFAKIASGSRLLCLNADYLFNARAYFNLASGSVEGTDSGSASIEDYGNGWYRCSITGTSSITGSSIAYFGLEDGTSDNGYVGDGTSGHYWYGIQAEAASYSSSYIPNHGSTGGVTRAADSCLDGGNSDVFNNSEGVLFIKSSAIAADSTNKVITISDGTTANRVQIYYNSSNNIIGGVAGQAAISYSGDITETTKIAFKYKANDFALWVNGVEVGTDNVGSAPSGLNQINFHNGASGSPFYGNMKQLVYFNEALSDSELATLTTL